MKRLLWIGLAVIVGAGTLVALRGQAIGVDATTPTRTTVREYIAEDAKTRLADEYMIDMPISGTLERITLDIGDSVEKGDVVVRVDTHDLKQRIEEVESLIEGMQAQVRGVDVQKPQEEDIESSEVQITEMETNLEIARKNLASAEIAYERAQKEFERAQSLVDRGAVSQSYFDDAESRYRSAQEDYRRAQLQEQAAMKALQRSKLSHERLINSIDDNEYMREQYKAEIQRLEAQLKVLRNDLKKSRVHAPVSGPVLEKYVDDRRVMAAGQPLMTIGAMESLEIECDVLSEEIAGVEPGNPVEVSGKALEGKTLTGTVERVHPAGFMKVSALGIEQQRVRTIIDCPECKQHVRPGTSVDVRIITGESQDTLAIPDRAAVRIEGEWSVFRIENGHTSLTPIEVGLRNDEWVEVLEGLSESDRIVAEPRNELTDGARVTVLSEE